MTKAPKSWHFHRGSDWDLTRKMPKLRGSGFVNAATSTETILAKKLAQVK